MSEQARNEERKCVSGQLERRASAVGWAESERRGFQVLAAADDAIFVYVNFFGNTESDDLFTHANTEAREVIALTIGPLEVDVFERSELTSFSDIQLDIS